MLRVGRNHDAALLTNLKLLFLEGNQLARPVKDAAANGRLAVGINEVGRGNDRTIGFEGAPFGPEQELAPAGGPST